MACPTTGASSRAGIITATDLEARSTVAAGGGISRSSQNWAYAASFIGAPAPLHAHFGRRMKHKFRRASSSELILPGELRKLADLRVTPRRVAMQLSRQHLGDVRG